MIHTSNRLSDHNQYKVEAPRIRSINPRDVRELPRASPRPPPQWSPAPVLAMRVTATATAASVVCFRQRGAECRRHPRFACHLSLPAVSCCMFVAPRYLVKQRSRPPSTISFLQMPTSPRLHCFGWGSGVPPPPSPCIVVCLKEGGGGSEATLGMIRPWAIHNNK